MIEFKPVIGLMGPFGHWDVNGSIFYTKKAALEYASTFQNVGIVWRWYNSVWDKFDKSKLGTVSLPTLYRLRAQQIRDSYDWVTLNYSGGADSHNILMSFLTNNIKLDHIYINWPMKTVNNKTVYTPNVVDKSASNILSEWDFVIKPTLDRVKHSNPEIEIEIGDWSENLTEKHYHDDNFTKSSTFWGAGSLFRNQNHSLTARKKVDQGLKVADVFGFDKPHLFLHEDNVTVSMFFHDVAFQTATNCTGTFEPFYWSHKLPELAYEMAYVNFKYYNINPTERKYIRSNPMRVSREITNEFNNQLCRKICYPETWDLRKFQSGKPWSGSRTDRDFWLYELPDFNRLISAWKYNHVGFLEKIHSRYFDDKGGLNPIRSRFYELGKFDSPYIETPIILS